MKNKKQLPIVNYNESEFSDALADALIQYGTCVLQNVPKISTEASKLFSEFDDLSSNPEAMIAGSGILDLAGFHPYNQRWAGRRFSECYGFVSDNQGKVTQSFPSEAFKNAALNFLEIAREVTNKVVDAINVRTPISDYFKDSTLLGIADSYVPPTQEDIEQLQSCGKLIITEDGRLGAFNPHRDVNPLTLIVYENNDCNGLEIELPNEVGELSYHSLLLPESKEGQLTILVLVGSPIEILTKQALRAPNHRVVLDPMQPGEKFSRRLASAFTLFAPKSKEQQEVIPQKEQTDATSVQEDFDQTEHIKTEYVSIAKTEKKQSIPLSFLGQFPRTQDVQKTRTEDGTNVYIRI